MKRAAIYTRISSDREGRELGIDRQEDDCRALAARLGYVDVDVVRENDVSASTRSRKRRPLYDDMLERARAGEYGAILAYSNSRLTRRPLEVEGLIELAERHGVRLHTVVSGDDDLATADGRMVARIKGSVDAAEAERTAERVARAKRQAATEGRYRGGRRPFGYEADGVTVRDDEAAAVLAACRGLLAGRSLASLARETPPTTGGKVMDAVALRRIVQRPRNAGLLEAGGEIVGEASWPAIVPEDVWRGAVAVLADPSRRTTPGPERRHLLSGIATCGACGATLKAHRPGGGRAVYTCRDRHVSRDLAALDDFVLDIVRARLGRGDIALRPAEGDPLGDEAAALRARLVGFEQDYSEGLIDGRQLRAATDRVTVRLERVEARMGRARRGSALAALGADPVAAFAAAPLDVQRAVVEALVTITVHRGRKGRPPGWKPGQPYADLESVEIKPRADR